MYIAVNGGRTTARPAILKVSDAVTPEATLTRVIAQLQGIVDDNPGTPLAARASDAIADAQAALNQLARTPPRYEGAVTSIKRAVTDLEAAINEGLDPAQGAQLMNQLAGAARQVTGDGINQAIAQGADSEEIDEAQQAFTAGDGLKASSAFRAAVGQYQNALESAFD